MFYCKLKVNGISKYAQYLVANNDEVDNILGIESLCDLDIIKFNYQLIKVENPSLFENEYLTKLKLKFPSLFEDRIGCIPSLKISIKVDESIQPIQQPAYPCPIALLEGTKELIEDMIRNDVIEEVPPGTDLTWISPINAVEKSNYDLETKIGRMRLDRNEMLEQKRIDKKFIRVTSNNKCLNKAIIKQKRLLPTLLNFLKYFSKVDIKSAFNTNDARREK